MSSLPIKAASGMILGKRRRSSLETRDNGRKILIVNGRLEVQKGVLEDTGSEDEGSHSTSSYEDDSDCDNERNVNSDGNDLELRQELQQSVATITRAANLRPECSTHPQSSRSRSTSSKPKPRYQCTHPSCTKSYTKPVRLNEHLRSHSGERPFVCNEDGCSASYLRDTHLQAHLRTHRKEEEKPMVCKEVGCGKRFWTNQHLNRHTKLIHEQDKGMYQVRRKF